MSAPPPAGERRAPLEADPADTALEALTPALEREWEALARRTSASPFLRPRYLRVWLDSFGDGGSPELVAARRAGALVGAMAVVRRGRILATPGNFETPAEGIVADDREAAGAVARAVLTTGSRRVDLQHLADGLSLRALGGAAESLGHRVVTRVTMRSPVVDTGIGWDGYWASRSRNLRHNVNRCGRRAGEAGEFAFEVVCDPDPGALHDLLEEGFAVEGSGWKAERGTAIATSPLTRGYYTDLARWAAEEGWLRLSFLRIDGRPIAFCLSVEAFGVHHALKMGYDDGLRRLSPGMLLLHGMIKRAFDEGIGCFDFAGHDEPYKMSWATGTEEYVSMTAFPASALGWATHRTEVARIALAESALRPVLEPVAVVVRRAGRLASALAGLRPARHRAVRADDAVGASAAAWVAATTVRDPLKQGVESPE